MNHSYMGMRSACLVHVFVGRMEMEKRQQKQRGEERDKNPCTPGW